MSNRYNGLALQALKRAAQVRQEAKLDLISPVNVYDLAERRGVDVQFVALASMEGMYYKGDQPMILISSLRPAGRQALTCGHELGHHEFKHGMRADELIEGGKTCQLFDPLEFLVDCFSGFLLMPKSTVNYAFTLRQWDIRTCTNVQTYIIAGWLGVGYSTLLHHMSNTIKIMPKAQAQQLQRATPKGIRAHLLGRETPENLIVVDHHWFGRAIDIQVGDFILAPLGTVCEGTCVELVDRQSTGIVFRGIAPGQGRLLHPESGWTSFTRVTRREYVGWNRYRYLEDDDE